MPAMSAQDLDIIKLTARFAARNGRYFISQLAQRESRNFQFDFLRPTHSLFPYFTELIRQYSKVLVPPENIKSTLSKNNNRTAVLDRIKQRVEWTVWDEEEKKKRAEEDEREKLAYASIDWHDFVVVETVEFTAEDEKMNLPAPMSLSELESMSLAQRRMASLNAMEDHEIPDFAAYEAALDKELGQDETVQQEQQPSTEEVPTKAEEQRQPDIQQHMVPPTNGAPIKIRTDYKPRLGPQAKTIQETQICPRCGESIPANEWEEHMRIELLDPKWKEQKLAQEAKLRDSNLLQEGTDVAKILKNFSSYRSDIFGAEETSIGQKLTEEEAAQQREQQQALWEQQQQQQQQQSQEEQNNDPYGTSSPSSSIQSREPTATFANQLPNMYNGVTPSSTSIDATTAAIRKAEEDDPSLQNDMKRQRLDDQQQPPPGAAAAAAGLGQIPTPRPPTWNQPTPTNEIRLVIQTIDYPEKPEWNLNGQPIELSNLPLTTMISTVKERITSQLGIPYGKQKLSIQQTVMVNSKSLGFYGCTDGTVLTLGLKDRKK
ncbi:unnamed protein product [Absidia cylindrospora]